MKTNLFFYSFVLSIISTLGFGEAKDFHTYVSIENVSEETGISVTFPSQKTMEKQEKGKKFEVPVSMTKANRFNFTVQMTKKGHSVNPCEFVVEQVSDYDRAYICTAQGIPATQVVVRVYTNLHGGDKVSGKQMLARR